MFANFECTELFHHRTSHVELDPVIPGEMNSHCKILTVFSRNWFQERKHHVKFCTPDISQAECIKEAKLVRSRRQLRH
ncbi:hypothetical protein NPIL_437721 [Nephila pilipes]|uniref:Uncharacterized protein n=1 Tax=Nephila pilipes TaxID=299642 RepID=A0A8X6P0V0_NEPPI|nr:hypothetical protein NPIL_437721 [Nephila pilipes]